MENEHAKIIEALGNPSKLSKMLGIPASNINNWKTRGIPFKYQISHAKLWKKGRKLAGIETPQERNRG